MRDMSSDCVLLYYLCVSHFPTKSKSHNSHTPSFVWFLFDFSTVFASHCPSLHVRPPLLLEIHIIGYTAQKGYQLMVTQL